VVRVVGLIVGTVVSMLFSLLLSPVFAKGFRSLNLGQFYRADTPTAHILKRGTPSMGGVIFLTGAIAGYLVGHAVGGNPITAPGLLVIGLMIGLALIGFADDLLKVSRRNSIGLKGSHKLIGSGAISIVFGIIALLYRDSSGRSPASTALSFVRDLPLDSIALFGTTLGSIVFVVWVLLISTSVSNAVNLADGLDGLATGSSIFAIGSYVLICYWESTQSCFSRTIHPDNVSRCYATSAPLDLAVIAASIVGALVGFLWWNTHPAQLSMGDTGAFGLGGALAALAILSRTELLLILIAGLFFLITSQVIVQRVYFKSTRGRRIWLASPLHHHFEMRGWAEVTIVVRFWMISAICSTVAVAVVYLEWLAGA